MTTIIVSPIARETASRMPPTMPGKAAGSITRTIASERVEPRPRAPSRMSTGTELMASSDREDTRGMIMIPMTSPAASALSDATASPSDSPAPRMAGATVSAAKNPYTTVGMPASTSSIGLVTARTRSVEYSAR